MLATISLSWWNASWPEIKVVHLISVQQGKKADNNISAPQNYGIIAVIFKSEKTKVTNSVSCEIGIKGPLKASYTFSRDSCL